MDIKDTIFALCSANGASGSETPAALLALDMLRKYCPDAEISAGNVIGRFGTHTEGKPSLVLDAHIDQVGMIVTFITDDGFIKFSGLGGLDRRLLPAQPVVIHGKRDIKGVICSIPPHLLSGDAEVVSFDDSAIDTGMTKDELTQIVSLGDPITYDVPCREMLGTKITARALDDRSGVAAILYALELLAGKETAYNVTAIFSTQEELGERGAKIGAFTLDPDYALAVDVSFAYAIGEDEQKCGKLGKGPMIGISPCLDRGVSQGLIEAAVSRDIPYQTEVMSGLTSTNADRYSVSRAGAKACTVSIPLRNMHTPVEVIDTEDVRLTGELLAAFIAREGQE